MTEEEKIKETIEAHGTTSKELAETKAKDASSQRGEKYFITELKYLSGNVMRTC